jgi:DNA replication protein DnaC
MPTDVVNDLRALGLRASTDTLRAFLEEATKARLSPVQTCERLVEIERRQRETRNLAARTKAATLGRFKTLDQFDWAHARAINRDLYTRLLDLDFVEHGHNVLFRGQAGAGKTTLAQNLGLVALQKGFTVRFSTAAAVLADLLKQESLPALERRMRRYVATDLLILDEIGYLPYDSRSADLLYNLISRRHLERSTIITTNLAFKQWGDIFPGAACIGALVDRFVQHCHVMDIDADSWRQRESLAPPPPAQRPRKPRSRS